MGNKNTKKESIIQIPEPTQKFKIDLQKAINGDEDAMYRVGYSYKMGTNGVHKNMKDAMKWFIKSKNNTCSQLHIGYAYRYGCIDANIYINNSKSMLWFMLSATNTSYKNEKYIGEITGHPKAQYIIGVDCYKKKQIGKAIEWLKKSANYPSYLGGNTNAKKKLENLKKNHKNLWNIIIKVENIDAIKNHREIEMMLGKYVNRQIGYLIVDYMLKVDI